ncbi:MAG: AlpA family phage regulatory protein [Pseudoxanthomonas sp.]
MDNKLESFRFLRLPEVKRVTGLSRTQIYRLEAAGQFCKRVKLGAGVSSATAWVSTDVESWMGDRIAASRKAAA